VRFDVAFSARRSPLSVALQLTSSSAPATAERTDCSIKCDASDRRAEDQPIALQWLKRPRAVARETFGPKLKTQASVGDGLRLRATAQSRNSQSSPHRA
jgi:hypothetical protein